MVYAKIKPVLKYLFFKYTQISLDIQKKLFYTIFNMKEKTCLLCLSCKLIDRNHCLSCVKGMWVKNDWDKKYIILTAKERETLDLRHRGIFNLAERCQQYEEM